MPLDERVTDASADARESIDVVVLARPSQIHEVVLYDDAAAVLEQDGFSAERFGTVTVYRRPVR